MSFTVIVSTETMPYMDWLEHRKAGIGGSDAAEAAYWGTQLEGLVRTEFTKRTGIEVEHRMELLRSDEHPFMQANLDGTCVHPEFGPCIFEAKTASAFKAGEWEDGIPDEYFLQVQHYMAVTGYQGAYIAALIGGNTFRWKFIPRDEELITILVQLEADFWQHVQSETPPPLDGSSASARFLAERFPNSMSNSRIELPNQAEQLIHQYDEASQQIKLLTERKQEAENLLKEMLGSHETGTTGDHLVTWKNVVQERLDTKTLKAEHPTLYKKYANPTSCRRFTIKNL